MATEEPTAGPGEEGLRGGGASDEAARWSAPAPRLRRREALEHRVARGRRSRITTPRSVHAGWEPAPGRPDPIALLQEQAESRVPELVPIRHGRMLVGPFAFFRGAALVMAADLAATPHSGLTVQLCGDAHLSNFGVFASPERRIVFDINDFDETLPGPWEWDVKRLAASFEIAGRERCFPAPDRRDIVAATVREYRKVMREAASMGTLEAWYAHLEIGEVLEWLDGEVRRKRLSKREAREAAQDVAKARTRDSMRAFRRLTEEVDGELRFAGDPPLLVPLEDLVAPGRRRDESEAVIHALLGSYRETLAGLHHPIEEFRYVDTARKVVGVGSVGTRAWILLLVGRDRRDPLVLQAKEAQASVLEPFLGRSEFSHHGQRVVAGQRLMQAATDIFLGWQRVPDIDGVTRDYYVRQLHDWKGSVDADTVLVPGATAYGRLCGATLARAHARSGDRIALAAYLGKGDAFDRAIVDFAARYADQNERDYEALAEAVRSGRLAAETGL
jgi:uncharacterized protein (DUF2252 family)